MTDFSFDGQPSQGAWHITHHIAVLVSRIVHNVGQLDETVADLRKLAEWLEQQRGALERKQRAE